MKTPQFEAFHLAYGFFLKRGPFLFLSMDNLVESSTKAYTHCVYFGCLSPSNKSFHFGIVASEHGELRIHNDIVNRKSINLPNNSEIDDSINIPQA